MFRRTNSNKPEQLDFDTDDEDAGQTIWEKLWQSAGYRHNEEGDYVKVVACSVRCALWRRMHRVFFLLMYLEEAANVPFCGGYPGANFPLCEKEDGGGTDDGWPSVWRGVLCRERLSQRLAHCMTASGPQVRGMPQVQARPQVDLSALEVPHPFLSYLMCVAQRHRLLIIRCINLTLSQHGSGVGCPGDMPSHTPIHARPV